MWRKGWKLNFDWLLKPANFVKVIEGNYRNSTVRNKVAGFIDALQAAKRGLQ